MLSIPVLTCEAEFRCQSVRDRVLVFWANGNSLPSALLYEYARTIAKKLWPQTRRECFSIRARSPTGTVTAGYSLRHAAS